MLHRSNGARRRLGGQKATFPCRLDGVLTDLCSSSWTFSSERRFCAAFSGSKWSGAFSGGVAAVGNGFCSSSWIEPSRFFTGFADRRVTSTTWHMDAQPPLPLLLSTVMSLELLYCSGIAVLTSVFANMQTDVNSWRENQGQVRKRERERERERDCDRVWLSETERDRQTDRQAGRGRERERERERASHLDQKKLSRGVQMPKEADWVPWKHLSTPWFPSGHQS